MREIHTNQSVSRSFVFVWYRVTILGELHTSQYLSMPYLSVVCMLSGQSLPCAQVPHGPLSVRRPQLQSAGQSAETEPLQQAQGRSTVDHQLQEEGKGLQEGKGH